MVVRQSRVALRIGILWHSNNSNNFKVKVNKWSNSSNSSRMTNSSELAIWFAVDKTPNLVITKTPRNQLVTWPDERNRIKLFLSDASCRIKFSSFKRIDLIELAVGSIKRRGVRTEGTPSKPSKANKSKTHQTGDSISIDIIWRSRLMRAVLSSKYFEVADSIKECSGKQVCSKPCDRKQHKCSTFRRKNNGVNRFHSERFKTNQSVCRRYRKLYLALSSFELALIYFGLL